MKCDAQGLMRLLVAIILPILLSHIYLRPRFSLFRSTPQDLSKFGVLWLYVCVCKGRRWIWFNLDYETRFPQHLATNFLNSSYAYVRFNLNLDLRP